MRTRRITLQINSRYVLADESIIHINRIDVEYAYSADGGQWLRTGGQSVNGDELRDVVRPHVGKRVNRQAAYEAAMADTAEMDEALRRRGIRLGGF